MAIDTSGKVASVAIFDDDKLIVEHFLNTGFTHSQTLMPIIDFCLGIFGINVEQIEEYIITRGPGSFTGLRIGMATVKGLATVNDIPCKAISTLEALAYNMVNSNGIICPVMDARCNQVYTGLFICENGNIKRIKEDSAISLENLKENLEYYIGGQNNIFLVGDGANLCYNYFKDVFVVDIDKFYVAAENLKYQKASSLFLASRDKEKTSFENLMPTYLRLCQAQRQFLNKNN